MKKMVGFGLVIWVIMAGNLWAAGKGVRPAEEMYRHGLSAEGAGEDERAIQIYERVADQYRDSDYATKALERAVALRKERQAKKDNLLNSVAVQCRTYVQECQKYRGPDYHICLNGHPECDGLRRAGRLLQ